MPLFANLRISTDRAAICKHNVDHALKLPKRQQTNIPITQQMLGDLREFVH